MRLEKRRSRFKGPSPRPSSTARVSFQW